MQRFRGQTAIVTGAAQGIGKATALALAREGANVTLFDLQAELVAEVVAEIAGLAQAGSAIAVVGDVASESDVRRAVESTIRQFGKIQVLVNNAGTVIAKELEHSTEEDFDRIFAVNVKGPFFFAKYVVPGMKQARKGSIVNVSSMGSVITIAGAPFYTASKAALNGLTRALGLELAPFGINVNAVAPGYTDTPHAAPFLADDNMRLAILADIPVERVARPEDIANAILWLASSESNYVQGQTLLVDGGYTLR